MKIANVAERYVLQTIGVERVLVGVRIVHKFNTVLVKNSVKFIITH